MNKSFALYLLILLSYNSNAQTKFSRTFAPQAGMVTDVEKPYRDEVCLNGSWQFMPVTLPEGSAPDEIKSPKIPATDIWEKTPVKVPSPWNVNGFEPDGGGDFRSFPGYPEKWINVKSGWLKKEVKVPAEWSGNRIVLHFEAVAGYAKVFVNRKPAGEHFDTFLPFDIDVTEQAKPGETVEVLVWVAHGSLFNTPGKYGFRNHIGGSFWGNFAVGIWQDVYLQKLPQVYVTSTFVKPLVDKDELELKITIKNTTDKSVNLSVASDIYRWISKSGKSMLDAPEINWELGQKSMSLSKDNLVIKPQSEQTFTFSAKVNRKLDLWSPESPNLCGLIVSVNGKKQVLDKSYSRFGWRQFSIKGKEFYLNGNPVVLKGDSWHFMGVPQMTRRYAYSWYRMLLDANANSVRLHAQIYPGFYLDMADEMGICVLDETAIWASDGGPKIDSEVYWEACKQHVKGLILRDRNHPSVFGWSVCNETLPVTHNVLKAPDELINRNIKEINQWVALAKETDPTRDWISGDGETDDVTDLPTVIGHYGNIQSMKKWSGMDKPWGIGETGMAYYGTPYQVAKVNGDRAYESQLGRMEGLAGEAFDLISTQRKLGASYCSIFNLAWYGLKPLTLGLNDTSRPSQLTDGIFFGEYKEGLPGYQPERLGPYTTTFNPGYDPVLPFYETWPLFDAVKAAYSDQYASLDNIWGKAINNTVMVGKSAEMTGVVLLSDSKSGDLKQYFKNMRLRFVPFSGNQEQLIIVDGNHTPVFDLPFIEQIRTAIQGGSYLLIWGATGNSKSLIEALTESKIEFFKRDATSYVIKNQHAILNGTSNANYYFSEFTKQPVSEYSIGGAWLNRAHVILEACNTNWNNWNYQGEPVKTAKVLRSEREAKANGNVLVYERIGKGELLVSTIDFFKLGDQITPFVRDIIRNMGAPFNDDKVEIHKALNNEMVLHNALFLGSFKPEDEYSYDIINIKETYKDIKKFGKVNEFYWIDAVADSSGVFDFKKMNITYKEWCGAYLSFWVYSPRSLTDLLAEPDMPRLDMHFEVDDMFALYVNGNMVKAFMHKDEWSKGEAIYEALPLEKGWNHILVVTGQTLGDWKTKIRLASAKPEFLKEIKSAVDK
ncbi:MAG: glycoside hydrolase family 2 [Bacteroidales bacterium]|jgi:beta-galactosidase|nr:glycoside hydrolase family 2 [Bacteroidales bacterium]